MSARQDLSLNAFERAEQLRTYHAALREMPWNFEMEDAQDRWRGGVEALKSLHSLQMDCDPRGVLWMQYLDSIGRTTPGPRVGVFAA